MEIKLHLFYTSTTDWSKWLLHIIRFRPQSRRQVGPRVGPEAQAEGKRQEWNSYGTDWATSVTGNKRSWLTLRQCLSGCLNDKENNYSGILCRDPTLIPGECEVWVIKPLKYDIQRTCVAPWFVVHYLTTLHQQQTFIVEVWFCMSERNSNWLPSECTVETVGLVNNLCRHAHSTKWVGLCSGNTVQFESRLYWWGLEDTFHSLFQSNEVDSAFK